MKSTTGLSELDIEFLAQAENFYAGEAYTWSDERFDIYRVKFESEHGSVLDYIKSVTQGEHVSHRESARFSLTKVAVKVNFEIKCNELLDEFEDSYWMYKYDGCSLVAYYNKGILVQVCTKSAVDWGIDRTSTMGWLFPQVVDSNIDSIQGEALVRISDVGGVFKARSTANGLTNSKYKADKIKELIHVRAFKVGFVDGNSSVNHMIEVLTSLPIPEHGRFKPAKRLTKSDITSNEEGTEDFVYDGIVRYHESMILGYKRHSNEVLRTKITNIEWNLSDKGLFVPKYTLEKVVFNAVYDSEGNVIGGINVRQASCGSARRLFEKRAGVGSIVEVYRANATIPQVGNVIEPSSDYNLTLVDPEYYNNEGYLKDPFKLIEDNEWMLFGGGIKPNRKMSMLDSIIYWWGIEGYKQLIIDKPNEAAQFLFPGVEIAKCSAYFNKAGYTRMLNTIINGTEDEVNEMVNYIVEDTWKSESDKIKMFELIPEILKIREELR